MADQAITALPKKTYSGSSQIASTDYLLGIDSAEGYQMLIQDLGEYIINRATASLAGSTQTLASAISALNSKMRTIASGSLRDIKTSGIYYLTGTVTDKPANNGGYYSVSVYNNDLLFGLYATLDGSVFCVEFINGSWKYTQLATDSNTPGTVIDIRSYDTSSNYYTPQTDGYVQLQGADCRLVLSGGISLVQSTGNLCGSYVKKGLKIYVIGSPTTANFIPLS